MSYQREFTDDERADILTEAFDNIEQITEAEAEAASLNPHRADVIAKWNAMRPQQQTSRQREVLQPRQQKLDTQVRWDELDARICQHIDQHTNSYDSVIGGVIATLRHEWRAETSAEIAKLRAELNAAQAKIKQLENDKPAPNNNICRWKLDRKRYRVVPFYTNGQPGPPIPMRILFEQFDFEVSQRET